MRAIDTDYRDQLQALLPTGAAWPRDEDAQLSLLMHGLGGELARAHNRALDLLEEADPHTAAEMLVDWERVVGLPDPCIPLPSDSDARRLAVVGRLAARGGQSAAYYITLCASLGYAVTITDFDSFTVGDSACGDMLLDGEGEAFTVGDSACGDHLELFDWAHAWRLDGEPSISSHFICGDAECGDALGFRDNPEIRCLIGRLKPAHTRVAYTWAGLTEREEFPDLDTSEDVDFTVGESEIGTPLGSMRTIVLSAIADLAEIHAGAAQLVPAVFQDVSIAVEGVFEAGDAEAGTPLGYTRTTTFRAGQVPVTTFA